LHQIFQQLAAETASITADSWQSFQKLAADTASLTAHSCMREILKQLTTASADQTASSCFSFCSSWQLLQLFHFFLHTAQHSLPLVRHWKLFFLKTLAAKFTKIFRKGVSCQ